MSTPRFCGHGPRFTATRLDGCVELRVSGELDLLSKDRFQCALEALATDGVTTVHLEMSKLAFMDLTCVRELVVFARSHPRLRLLLHDPPHSLQRIIVLLAPPRSGTNIDIAYR